MTGHRELAMELAAEGEVAMLAAARRIAREGHLSEQVVRDALMDAGALVAKDMIGGRE